MRIAARSWRSSALPALLLLAGGASSGCYSKATAYDGKFTFAYASMVEHENFVKPIAPGAKLEVHAFANGTHDYLTIKGAKSSRPDVVAVHSTKDRSVILEGKAPGVAEIEVTSRDASGNELVDRMFFHVSKPALHRLQHSCTEEPEAAYVLGDDVFVNHDLATTDKRPVIGFDYAPLKIEPAGALELVGQPQAGGYYHFHTKTTKARITVRSTVDDKAISLRVLDRKELSNASLIYAERMLQGRGDYVVAVVSAGDVTLCSQNALTKARSLTPGICIVTANLDDDPDEGDTNHEQLARITGLAFGICKFEITLPELAKGKGVVLAGEVKIGREEYPGEQRTPDEIVREHLLAWSRPLGTIASAKEVLALAVAFAWWLRRRRRPSLKAAIDDDGA